MINPSQLRINDRESYLEDLVNELQGEIPKAFWTGFALSTIVWAGIVYFVIWLTESV